MLNNTYLNACDRVTFTNLSKYEKKFKCTIPEAKETQKLFHAVGLEVTSNRMVIIVHGFAEVEVKDILTVLGERYQVELIKEAKDYKLANLRKDYNRFPSQMTIYLEN
jgi:hypothetical protein